MVTIKKIFIKLLFVPLLFSCNKNLSLKPLSAISNASFWQTKDDAEGALYGMYTSLRAEAENYDLFYLGEARSEVLGPSFSFGPNQYWENVLDANNSGPDWRSLYNVIHSANLILKYVPGISFTSEANKKSILAQAYTMRAYIYFTMVKTWGDLPMVTEPTEGFDAELVQLPRTSGKEIFQLIKQDLEDAIGLFPDNSFSAGRNIWSLPAAKALKADVYLWTGKRLEGGQADINIALSSLNDIQSSDVSLLPDFSDIFAYNNKGNKEILMSIGFQDLESGNNWGAYSYMVNAYVSPNFDAATIEYIGVMGGSPSCTISDLVRGQYSADDLRRDRTFYEMYTTDPVTGIKSFYGSFATKYKGTVISGVRKFIDDIVLYRYADVLLMKAEAKNALGQDPSAEINQVRQRAYGTNFSAHEFVSSTQEQNDQEILKERLLELAFEGKRWWDLIRFNQVFEKVPSLQSRAGQSYLLLFPIPESVISLSPKIVQNPGY